MPRTKALSFALSAVALTLSSPALAVTAEELWAEWQTQAASLGQVMTAAEVVAGAGSLTLRGFSTSFSDGEVSTVGRVDEVVMTENADGTVSIDMSDVYALTISFVDLPGTPPVNIGINLLMPDLEMTASGEVGARIYDYSAARLTFEDGPITGGDGPPPTIDMRVGMENFVASYQIDGTDPDNISYASTASIDGIAGVLDVIPPPSEVGRLKLSFSVGATTVDGSGSLGDLMQLSANPDMIPTDYDLRGDITYGSASVEVTFEHPTDAFNLFASNDGGRLTAVLSDSLIDYSISTAGSVTHFSGADLPVPIEFSVGSAEIALNMPLRAAPDPQPFASRVAYQDVVFSAQIWALADPTASFPQDPVTAIIDLSGTVQIMRDLMAMAPGERGLLSDMGLEISPSAELRELTLNDLRLSIGDTALTGSGSASFAPGAGPGAAAVPVPVGSIDLQLAGANALLDRLQASGLVPIEQLAMARGLLGAFARPGATPDTLESTIQFTEGGGITANGVPLQ